MNNSIYPSIYQQMVEAGVEIDHHATDLYVPVTEASTELVCAYRWRKNVTTFINQVTGDLWYDIPFAYEPAWGKY